MMRRLREEYERAGGEAPAEPEETDSKLPMHR
jgi:hypothetical protein